MNGNIFTSLGMAAGIAVGLVIAVLLVRFANRNKKYKTEYDERQIRARGDAYRYAFYTLVIYEVILFLLEIGEISLPIYGAVLHMCGVILAITVLCVYCIWKDAYWGMNNNRKRYGVIMILGGLFNALPVVAVLRGSTTFNSRLSSGVFLNFCVCVMLLVIGAAMLLKHLKEQHTGEAEN